MASKYDFIVVGGGIVGLATAYQLLQKKPDARLLLLEKEKEVAMHQTGNNSGVIHSGIYYKPGSLKAINCIRGHQLLIDFCTKEKVKFELCGKVIVATDPQEIPALENIYQRGLENGLEGLKKLNKDQIAEYEPNIAGIAGIHVPQTGIIDYKEVSLKLAEKIRIMGGEINLYEEVIDIIEEPHSVQVISKKETYICNRAITCGGLFSDKLARKTHPRLNMKIIPFRGEYYELTDEKASLIKNLVYPVPDPNFPFLGVHFTRMINGGVEAGPNAVLAYKREGYKKRDFSAKELGESLLWPGFQKVALKYWKTGMGELYRSYSKNAFTKALQKLLPDLQEHDLKPGGAGVRAQACDRKGGLIDDFVILESKRVVNVCNAPSPAATSSLSIGLTVAGKALS